jgi:hypothetical protein
MKIDPGKKGNKALSCVFGRSYIIRMCVNCLMLSLPPGVMHGGDDIKIVVVQDESFHVPHLVETFPLDFLERRMG